MIIHISSLENKVVKHIKKLKKRRYREKYNQYILEGIRLITDAMDDPEHVDCVLFCEGLNDKVLEESLLNALKDNGINIYEVSEKIFTSLCETQTPQGILAIGNMKKHTFKSIKDQTNLLVVVLDRIQDPGNLGTIIRTADAGGLDAVILSKGCVDVYNPKTIRSTMGSIFHIPVIEAGETMDLLDDLKNQGFGIITTSLKGHKYHYEVNYTGKKAFVVGNEGSGVLKEVEQISDELIKIPMIGKAESLNASIAASIVMYEGVRQRINQKI